METEEPKKRKKWVGLKEPWFNAMGDFDGEKLDEVIRMLSEVKMVAPDKMILMMGEYGDEGEVEFSFGYYGLESDEEFQKRLETEKRWALESIENEKAKLLELISKYPEIARGALDGEKKD